MIAYAAAIANYRLWFSLITHFPGSKLALTHFYEIYYDIVLGANSHSRLPNCITRYAGVVCISPWEVHVSNPDFHSHLYRPIHGTNGASLRDRHCTDFVSFVP